MIKGRYVVRQTRRQSPNRQPRLIVESRPFGLDEYWDSSLTSWLEFVQSQHPRDKVFVITVS